MYELICSYFIIPFCEVNFITFWPVQHNPTTIFRKNAKLIMPWRYSRHQSKWSYFIAQKWHATHPTCVQGFNNNLLWLHHYELAALVYKKQIRSWNVWISVWLRWGRRNKTIGFHLWRYGDWNKIKNFSEYVSVGLGTFECSRRILVIFVNIRYFSVTN